jgi:hypothetical protein
VGDMVVIVLQRRVNSFPCPRIGSVMCLSTEIGIETRGMQEICQVYDLGLFV